MREIKFRAWDRKVKRWMHFTLPDAVTASSELLNNDCDLDWTTLAQFTGLHSKSGVEIYEGDIVRLKRDDERDDKIDQIIFHEGMFSPTYSTLSLEWHIENQNLEIIGNVFENPELLTV